MSTSEQASGDGAGRKPCIAVMGEFSVGKSTLSNLLIGSSPLPVKVTATQLPPVWMAYGDRSAFREDLDGNEIPVDLDRLHEIPLHETSVIRIFLQADFLKMCDFIDMPGISDPNMPAEVWERVVHHADGVLWCTHATQAWRQSEAAVWKSLPEELRSKSFLLITRIDKLLSERDRRKVVNRVSRETEGLFSAIFPISLTQALAAQDDRDQWQASGAAAFSQELNELLQRISATLSGTPPKKLRARPAPIPEPTPEAGDKVFHLDENQLRPAPQGAPSVGTVTPARVRVASGAHRPRPRPERPPTSAVGSVS